MNKSDQDFFCPAPWTNIHINQINGETRPCCGGPNQYKGVYLGSITNADWSYINGDNASLQTIRREMSLGVEPQYCKGCVEKDWYNNFLKYRKDIESGLDEPWQYLKSMDIRWGDTCQLSCLYCNEWASSKWASLKQRSKFIPIKSSRSYRDQYHELYNLVEKHGHGLERISLLGGEPLLLNENIELLDLLPDIEVDIFSNLNLPNIQENKVYQRLIRRNRVIWRISMENIGPRFEFVRRGSSWPNQMSNIQKLYQNCIFPSVVRVHAQYCVYSALNLSELYDYFAQYPNIEIEWNILSDPKPLDLLNFPKNFRDRAIDEILTVIKNYEHAEYPLSRVLERLSKPEQDYDNDAVQKCLDWHHDMETKYFNNHKKFLDLWPCYTT
jgi:uncharacterized Fe-S cluster-containing radical SAM superfamily protein